jgi:predicted DNA-binding transcriptional regulator YafY
MKITNDFFSQQHISIKDYFPSINKNKNFQTVVIQFSPEIAKEFHEQKYYYGFVSENKVGNHIEMTFLVDSFEWIGYWLLALGNKASVKEPGSLIDFLKGKVKLLSKYYL